MRYGLLWLASFFLLLSRLFSKLTQVVACIGTSFLSVAKKYSIAWIDHVLFVHSSLAGPLMSCFHLWAIMQGAFVFKFLCEHMFLFYLDIYLKVEIMSHMVILCLTYWGKLIWKKKRKDFRFSSGCKSLIGQAKRTWRVPLSHPSPWGHIHKTGRQVWCQPGCSPAPAGVVSGLQEANSCPAVEHGSLTFSIFTCRL